MINANLFHAALRLVLVATAILALFGPAISSVAQQPAQQFAVQPAHPSAPTDPDPGSNCLLDTSQADFEAGSASGVDLATAPGSAILAFEVPTLDQVNANADSTFAFRYNAWLGQTFTPATSGLLTQLDIAMFCAGCSTTPAIDVRVYATSGGLPVNPALASGFISGVGADVSAYYSIVFATPPAVTAGTRYAFSIGPVQNPAAGAYQARISSSNPYAAGGTVTSLDQGGTWSAVNSFDLGFKTYIVQPGAYATSGWLTSPAKDVYAISGQYVPWNSLVWKATAPSGTAVKFQAASSTSAAGPFNFVGPDGTANSYYTTSVATLAPGFSHKRFLKWKVFLSTADTAISPSLAAVSLCFDNTSALAVSPAVGVYGGTTVLTATLTVDGSALANKTVVFSLNGGSVGSAMTDSSGKAVFSAAGLGGLATGTYVDQVGAAFAGDSLFYATNGSADLTVSKATATLSLGTLNFTYDGTPKAAIVGATHPPRLAVVLTYNGASTAPGNAGSYPVLAVIDDPNYQGSITGTLLIDKAQAIIRVIPYNVAYDGRSYTATGTALGVEALPVDLTYLLDLSATTHTHPGSYGDTWTFAGNNNYLSAGSSLTNTITQAVQSITFAALPDRKLNSPAFGLSAGASSGEAVSFSVSGPCELINDLLHLLGMGVCQVTATQPGSLNYAPATPVVRDFEILAAELYLPLVNK